MSTRSCIGKVFDDGFVKVVYCHYDGYPEGVGACLAKCHNCSEDAEEILSLGSISSLGILLNPIDGVEHTFENPCKEVTVAYHRDRGEELVKPTMYENKEKCVTNAWNDFDAEYVYLWANHKWECYSTSTWGEVDLYGKL